MRTTRMEMAVEAYDGNGSKIRMEMDGPYGLPYFPVSVSVSAFRFSLSVSAFPFQLSISSVSISPKNMHT